jgi:hypothetical protein
MISIPGPYSIAGMHPCLGWTGATVGCAALMLVSVSPACRPLRAAVGRTGEIQDGAQSSRYANEQEWIVSETARSILALTYFARTRRIPDTQALTVTVKPTAADGDGPRFTLAVEEPERRQLDLALRRSIWDPRSYATLARSCLRGQPAVHGDNDASTVRALTNLTPQTLVAENERISALLAERPSDPELHEQAALLLSAFGLREASSLFWDARVILCRMAAHLAVAHALRGEEPASVAGQLAQIALDALSLRQKAGADALERLPIDDRSFGAWARALRTRITKDWRILAPQPASLLERLEYFRALARRRGGASTHDFLNDERQTGLADWGRISMQEVVTVESCQTFGSFDVELSEAAEAWTASFHRTASPSALIQSLDEESPGPIAQRAGERPVRVIDWGLWAAFEQRHLLGRLQRAAYCDETLLRAPEDARRVRSDAAKMLGSMRLYPLLGRLWATNDDEYRAMMPAALALAHRRPELVNGILWMTLLEKPSFATGLVPGMISDTQWFSPLLPFGTPLEQWVRLPGPAPHRRLSLGQQREVIAMAPYDAGPIRAYVYQQFETPSADQIRDAFGSLVETDVHVMRDVAWALRQRPVERLLWLQKACDLEVDWCGELGAQLREQQRSSDAAGVYRRFIETARARVDVCPEADWLLHYDYERRDAASARGVAQTAADAHCKIGPATLGSLCERDGALAEAERYFAMEARRSAAPSALWAFYRRQVEGRHEGFRWKLQALEDELFPGGLRHVDRNDFNERPRGGVLVMDEDARHQGLQQGDVIVAIDGIEVRDYDQYSLVRDGDAGMDLHLIVWRGGDYRDLQLSGVPERRVDAHLTTYPQASVTGGDL